MLVLPSPTSLQARAPLAGEGRHRQTGNAPAGRSRPLAARRPCQRPSPAPGQAHHRLQVQRALVVGRTRQSRSRATARATSNDDTCARTRARRCTRELDAAAGPRPAAREPAARQRRLCCSVAFARSVPAPRCVAGAQRSLHACERATYPRDVRDERRAARASARGVRGGVALIWTEERTRRDAPRSP